MAGVKRTAEAPACVVIGDLVGSRRSTERAGLHRRLDEALGQINERYRADLRITAGDEYQGTLPSLGAATAVTLHLRLALLPSDDVRHGIGSGATTLLDSTSGIEDGPGWWAARDAITEAEQSAQHTATRWARTSYREAPGLTSPLGDAVRAALLGRDHLVGRLDERSVAVLRGLLAGRTQHDIAEEIGVSPSAISQRIRNDGLGVIVAMTQWLEGIS